MPSSRCSSCGGLGRILNDRDKVGQGVPCEQCGGTGWVAPVTAQQILDAIKAGFAQGGEDEWDAPEFASARDLTLKAGCSWDFASWRDTAATIRNHGRLGGMALPDKVEAAVSERPTWYYVLRRLVDELPQRRDWLDPDLEAMARAVLAKAEGR